jgi:dipeptidyl aminopeptidase/acylaminoacyl peptidase
MRPFRVWLALAVLLAARPGQSAEPAHHVFRFDDYLALSWLTEAVPSPAGDAIAVVVKAYEAGPKAWRTHLELVTPAGTRRLTSSPEGESEPFWSPDGKRLGFVSGRGGADALWELRLDGGEATRLLDLPLGGGAPAWLPDGSGLIVAVEVFELCGADLACTKKMLDERAASGVSARVYDDLGFRPWSRWRDGRVQHLLRYDVASKAWTDLTPGPADVPVQPFGGRDEYDLCPDGRTLVYSVKPVEGAAWRTDTHLVALDLKTGARRDLPGLAGYDVQPRCSPDSKRVASISMARDQYESDRHALRVIDLETRASVEPTAGFDDWALEPVWDPRGDALLFATQQAGRQNLMRVASREASKPEVLAEGGVLVPKGVLRWKGEPRLVALSESNRHAPRVVLVDPKKGGEPQVAFDPNAEAYAHLDFATFDDLYVAAPTARDPERKVHAFVLWPHGLTHGVRQPFLLLLHGGPQGAWLDQFHPRWNAQLFAAMGWPVVLLNPAGSTGWGQAYVEDVSKDWGGQPLADVNAVLDALALRPDIDATRVCAAGGSYGGFLTNWLEGHSTRFKCLVSHAGVANQVSMYGSTDELFFPEWEFGGTPWEHPELFEKWSPVAAAGAFQTPMLVVHGQNDMRVPLEQGLSMFTLLKRRGVEARLVVFPDETHFVARPANARFWYDELERWFRKHLEGAPE